MGHAPTRTRLTPADFLAWEDTQTERHEFVDGETFVMVGAPCRVFAESMKLQVADDLFYPDVLSPATPVTCAPSRSSLRRRCWPGCSRPRPRPATGA